jgi:hypothetical protein
MGGLRGLSGRIHVEGHIAVIGERWGRWCFDHRGDGHWRRGGLAIGAAGAAMSAG